MSIDSLSTATVAFGLIYVGLNLTMSTILKRNGYTIGFFDINIRLFIKFKKMINEEKDSSRRDYYKSIYVSAMGSVILAIVLGILASV